MPVEAGGQGQGQVADRAAEGLDPGRVHPGRAGQGLRLRVPGRGRGDPHAAALTFGAEGQAPVRGQLRLALVLQPAHPPLGPEGQLGHRLVGIVGPPPGVGQGQAQAVLHPPAGDGEGHPRIAQGLPRAAALAGVGEDVGGGGKPVEGVAGVGPDRPQVQPDVRGEIRRQPPAGPRPAVAVPLGPGPGRRDPVGGEDVRRQPPGQGAASPADPAAQVGGPEAARLRGPFGGEGPRRGKAGREADHPADGLPAPDGRLDAAQDLDPRDVAHQEVGGVVGPADHRGVVQAHAVDDEEGLLGLRAPDPDRRHPAGAPIAGDPHAGGRRQQVGDHQGLAVADHLRRDDGDASAALRSGHGRAVGHHHEGVDGGSGRRDGQGCRPGQYGKTHGALLRATGDRRGGRNRRFRPAGADRSSLSSVGRDPVLQAHPGPSDDDGVRQVSWLAGHRPLRVAFPARSPRVPGQWPRDARTRRLQLRGQPGPCTRVPFSSPLRENLTRDQG